MGFYCIQNHIDVYFLHGFIVIDGKAPVRNLMSDSDKRVYMIPFVCGTKARLSSEDFVQITLVILLVSVNGSVKSCVYVVTINLLWLQPPLINSLPSVPR